MINDACVMAKKPFCHAGIIRFRGQLMTWPSYKKPKRLQPLDNIIVKGFEMRNVQVKSSDKLSDHKMLSCELKFKGEL